MKKIIILSAMLLLGSEISSQSLAYQGKASGSYYKINMSSASNEPGAHLPVSIVSKNRDTLWLADTSLGRMIGQMWKTGPLPSDTRKPPVIIYVKDLNNLPIVQKNSRKKIKQ